jgi:hypothetical protein
MMLSHTLHFLEPQTHSARVIVLIVSVLVGGACASQPAARATGGPSAGGEAWSPALVDTLVRLGREDQSGRAALAQASAAQDTATLFGTLRADTARSLWLRRVVREHGWPTRASVGDSAAHGAWLILQHSSRGAAAVRSGAVHRSGARPPRPAPALRIAIRRGRRAIGAGPDRRSPTARRPACGGGAAADGGVRADARRDLPAPRRVATRPLITRVATRANLVKAAQLVLKANRVPAVPCDVLLPIA